MENLAWLETLSGDQSSGTTAADYLPTLSPLASAEKGGAVEPLHRQEPSLYLSGLALCPAKASLLRTDAHLFCLLDISSHEVRHWDVTINPHARPTLTLY